MKKIWQMLALGGGAFLLFALVTVPATVVTSRLESFGAANVIVAGVTGTLWNGSAQVVQVNSMNAGAVSWNLHPLSLLIGRLDADVKLTRNDGFAQANVSARPSGRVSFNELTASVPLQALQLNALPGNFAGLLNVKLATLVVEKNWPSAAAGTIEALDLVGPANKPAKIGSYQLIFTLDDAQPGELVGALSDLNGPLQIRGKITLKAADKSYLVEGMVATRPDTPADVVNSLQLLGPPDANGNRPFSIAGTL